MDDLVAVVSESMSLSEDDLRRLAPDGKTTQIRYRISWAKSRLKKAELAYYPSPGMIAITEKGSEKLASNPSRIYWRTMVRKEKERTGGNDLPGDTPTFEDMMLPLLSEVGDGRKYSMDDLENAVTRRLNLSDEILHVLTPNRQMTKVRHRLGWAKSYLKSAKLVNYPSRGLVAITEKGRDVLNSNPPRIDRAFLNEMNDSDDAGLEENNDDLTPVETIEREHGKIVSMLENDLLEKVRTMRPQKFERMVLDLCEKMNGVASYVHTGKPGDKGIDGIITLNEGFGLNKIYVQAKRHKHPVSTESVRAFVGALTLKPTKNGMFVTTTEIPASAKEEVEENKDVSVRLVDGGELVRLMIKHDAGVAEVNTLKIKKIDHEYFDGFD